MAGPAGKGAQAKQVIFLLDTLPVECAPFIEFFLARVACSPYICEFPEKQWVECESQAWQPVCWSVILLKERFLHHLIPALVGKIGSQRIGGSKRLVARPSNGEAHMERLLLGPLLALACTYPFKARDQLNARNALLQASRFMDVQ